MNRDSRLTPNPEETFELADETVVDDRFGHGNAPMTLVSSSPSAEVAPAHHRVATGTYAPLETSPYEDSRVDSSRARVVFRMSLVTVLVTVFGAFIGGVATTIAIERFTGVNPAVVPVAEVIAAPSLAPATAPAVAPAPVAAPALAAAPAPTAAPAPIAAPAPVARPRAARSTVPVTAAEVEAPVAEKAAAEAETAEQPAEPKAKRAKAPAKAEDFPDPFAE